MVLCGHNVREDINEMIHAWMTDEKDDFYNAYINIVDIVSDPILTEDEYLMLADSDKVTFGKSIVNGQIVYQKSKGGAGEPTPAVTAGSAAASNAAAGGGGGGEVESDDEVIDVDPSGNRIIPPASAFAAAAASAPAAPPEPNYYDLLGIRAGAPLQEIRSKFRQLVVSEHPERGGDPQKFQVLNKAYSVLSDTKKRAEYDQTLAR